MSGDSSPNGPKIRDTGRNKGSGFGDVEGKTGGARYRPAWVTLAACSLSEPAQRDFVLVNPRAAETAAAEPQTPSDPGSWAKKGKKKGKKKAGNEKGGEAETANTLEAAEAACKAETERKGIASMIAIFSRLRKGSADEDYVACMKQRGYEVKQ